MVEKMLRRRNACLRLLALRPERPPVAVSYLSLLEISHVLMRVSHLHTAGCGIIPVHTCPAAPRPFLPAGSLEYSVAAQRAASHFGGCLMRRWLMDMQPVLLGPCACDL